jgi:hypothetical protein
MKFILNFMLSVFFILSMLFFALFTSPVFIIPVRWFGLLMMIFCADFMVKSFLEVR